jgi:hypothetical protein
MADASSVTAAPEILSQQAKIEFPYFLLVEAPISRPIRIPIQQLRTHAVSGWLTLHHVQSMTQRPRQPRQTYLRRANRLDGRKAHRAISRKLTESQLPEINL